MNRTSRQKFTKEIEDLNNTKLTRSYRYTQNTQKSQNINQKQQFKEGLTREIIKYFEMSENKSTTYQNVWSTVKTVLKGKL